MPQIARFCLHRLCAPASAYLAICIIQSAACALPDGQKFDVLDPAAKTSKLKYTKLPSKILGSDALIARREIDQLKPFLEKAPNNAVALAARARCYMKIADYDHAAADCERALKIDPKQVDAGNLAYTLTDVYIRDLDEEHAAHFLDLTINAFPNQSRLYAERGELLHGMGKSTEGLQDETKAISLNPNNARAYFARAEIEEALKNPKAAIADFGQSAQYHILVYTSLWRMAQCYEQIKDWKEAAAVYARIKPLGGMDQTDKLKAIVRRGDCLEKLGDTAAALKEYNEVITAPRERTMKLERNNPAGEQSEALQERANIYFGQKKYDLAIRDYTMLIGLDEEWGEHTPKWYLERAKLYRLTGKNDLATRDEKLARTMGAKK